MIKAPAIYMVVSIALWVLGLAISCMPSLRPPVYPVILRIILACGAARCLFNFFTAGIMGGFVSLMNFPIALLMLLFIAHPLIIVSTGCIGGGYFAWKAIDSGRNLAWLVSGLWLLSVIFVLLEFNQTKLWAIVPRLH